MTYGGSPNDWWQMPPIRLAGYAINRVKVEAHRSLALVDALFAADSALKVDARMPLIQQWRDTAGIKPAPKTMDQKIAELRQMGISVEEIQ